MRNRKIMSCFLAIVIIVSTFAAPARAVAAEPEILRQDTLGQQYLFATEFSGVMKDNGGNYALVSVDESGASSLLPVGCITIDLLDSNLVNAILTESALSRATKEKIAQLAADATICTECDTCNIISVFSPDLLPKTRTSSVVYDTYDGVQMKVEQISKDNHVGFASVGGGRNATAVWSGITSITISAVGVGSIVASIFGVGLSLMDAIADCTGRDSVYPAGGNDVQAKIRFNESTRYTYAYIEDWRIGCVSRLARVDAIEFSYEIYENNTRVDSNTFTKSVNRSLKSESYDNHLAVARNNYDFAKVDDSISVKIGSKTFYLVV